MPAARDDTHFGRRTVPLDEKQGLVDDVFHKVAGRYDLMNDLMSFGLHRAWKDALVAKVRPSRRRPFAHVDVAGGTGDVAMRVADAGGPLTSVTLVDVNADMLRVGEERAAKRSFSSRLTFVEGNAEALPLPDSRFDAYTIAFGIRNVPRIEAALSEAYRVLKRGGRFLCLEFSRVDLPGGRTNLRRLFVRRDPGPGQGRDRRRRPLPLSRRIDSQVSVSRCVRRDDRRGRLRARRLHAPERRDRRDPLGLEALIVGILSSLGHGSRLARAAYRVCPRRGVCRRRSGSAAAGAEAAARVRQLDCKTRRRWSGGPFAGDRSIGSVLRQARTIPFDAARHRRRQGRGGARAAAGSRRADEPRDGGRHHRGLVRDEDRIAVREFRRAGRGGFNRPGPSR